MAKIGYFWRGLFCCIFLLSLFVAVAQTASASPYGTGSFGACKYQQNCPPSSTQTTLPDGLKVSVNLVEGQTIPKKGYKIIVTPLNGQGTSFKKVDFFINDKSAQSVLPDDTGTASWFWDPSVYKGTNVKIIVTGTDGSSATKEFNVRIETADTSDIDTAASVSQAKKPVGISGLFHNVAKSLGRASDVAEDVIRKIPKPVAYSFPYILFILLAINILLLLIQTQRELKEYRKLRAMVSRKQVVADSKKTLMELTSHYLRTPLTIISGGIDMLSRDSSTAPYAVRLQTASRNLQAKVEQLVASTQSLKAAQASNNPAAAIALDSPWRNPGLFLPLIGIAATVAIFNYLASNAGALDLSQTNLAIQSIVFVLLVIFMYQVFRNRQLRHRDKKVLDQLYHDEELSNQARDTLIAGAVDGLNSDITTIDLLSAQLPPSQSSAYIKDGQARFHDLLNKFTVARGLRGGRSNSSPEPIQFHNLLAAAMQSLQPEADKRSIIINKPADISFGLQEPELLAFVLHSVVDNAIAYSPDNSQIEISAGILENDITIRVTDHGSGLSPEKIQMLFQPFFKAEGAEHFTHQGMGFNLYLDKLIMSYLGGSIDLQSKPGAGTTVSLYLPKYVP